MGSLLKNAANFVTGGLAGGVVDIIGTVIDRQVVDKAAAEKLKSEIASETVRADIQAMLSQLEINKIEAQSDSIFKSGWRPYLGWVGGAALTLQCVVIPVISYGCGLFMYAPPPPLELPSVIWEVLFGILGIGIGARTYEKINNVASK
jgi:hypothetical protein